MLYEGNQKITLSNESPRTPSVVSSHSRATASNRKAILRLRVRNRCIKSARKIVIPGRKQTLVKDNRKLSGEKLRVVANYTFYRGCVFFSKTTNRNSRSMILPKIRKLDFRSSRISSFGARSVGHPGLGAGASGRSPQKQ